MRCALFVLFISIFSFTVIADTYTLEPVSATMRAPGTIIINVMVNTTQQVYGLELTVKDTPEYAVFSHVETTNRTTGALATSATQGADVSKLALILSGTGSGITIGNGSILKIHYSVSSGTGSVNFQTSNFKVYNKNGAVISGNSISGTTITLESSSSSSAGSSGGGGGGGSGGSGSSSSSSGSSASTSANTNLPFSFPETKLVKEKPAPTQPPKVIEISAAPAETPVPQAPAPVKPPWPWIIGVLVFLAGSVLIIYLYKTQLKI